MLFAPNQVPIGGLHVAGAAVPLERRRPGVARGPGWGSLNSVARVAVPEESAEVVPEPSSKCQRPSRPRGERDATSCAQVAPQAPQLPASVAMSSQVIGTTTPTTSRPFAPAPIVCENVSPLAPVPVALASTATPPAPGGLSAGAGARCPRPPGRKGRSERGEPLPAAHAGHEAERQQQLQRPCSRGSRAGDRATARRRRSGGAWPPRRTSRAGGTVAGAPPVAPVAPGALQTRGEPGRTRSTSRRRRRPRPSTRRGAVPAGRGVLPGERRGARAERAARMTRAVQPDAAAGSVAAIDVEPQRRAARSRRSTARRTRVASSVAVRRSTLDAGEGGRGLDGDGRLCPVGAGDGPGHDRRGARAGRGAGADDDVVDGRWTCCWSGARSASRPRRSGPWSRRPPPRRTPARRRRWSWRRDGVVLVPIADDRAAEGGGLVDARERHRGGGDRVGVRRGDHHVVGAARRARPGTRARCGRCRSWTAPAKVSAVPL